jgi:hypothetical protein
VSGDIVVSIVGGGGGIVVSTDNTSGDIIIAPENLGGDITIATENGGPITVDINYTGPQGPQGPTGPPAPLSWEYYASNWSVPPAQVGTTAEGVIYSHILDGITRYRFIPTAYNAAQDAFYSDLALTALIVARG